MPKRTPANGYGNIYTPHAGAMIIQVQREGGLQNRTIILTPRQVHLLQLVTSRAAKIIAIGAAVVIGALMVEAARVPVLSARMSRLQHAATRLDTLERSLSELQQRYDQVERMLGAKPTPALAPASSPVQDARRATNGQGNVPASASKSSVPMD